VIRVLAVLILALAATHVVAAAQPRPATIATPVEQSAIAAFVEQPRAAAYFVGDLLTQRVLLRSAGGDLHPGTLPTPGRVSAWFERRNVMLETDASSRRWLVVQYQVLNAPQKLTPVILPGWTLATKGPGLVSKVVLNVPSSKINVAPLSPPGSPTQVGVADLRPDHLAPLIAEAPIRSAITLSASALALTVAAWLGWFLWRNRRAGTTQPFARAVHELRGLDDRDPRAWQVVHRAFDRTAGRVVQVATLPELFDRAPQLIPVREKIEHFFAQSSLLFFGEPGSLLPSPAAPRALCEELRRIERRYER
jgi:mxaA protein